MDVTKLRFSLLNIKFIQYFEDGTLWRRGAAVITTAQLHSTKPKLRFYAGSNPAHGVLEIRNGEDL